MHSRGRMHVLISVAIAEGAGIMGSLYTFPALSGWYTGLVKPPLTPPGWVFGPVWIFLYACMGVAAAVVWHHGHRHKRVRHALWLYALQLGLTIMWSVLFFGGRSSAAGLVDIFLLWGVIGLTTFVFWRISRTAGLLFVPYLLWVTFAFYLNAGIFLLNPGI